LSVPVSKSETSRDRDPIVMRIRHYNRTLRLSNDRTGGA
jgi:hypothetical protein